MFGNAAQDIVFLLSRRKMLDTDNREVYIYAMEVLLLNASILIFAFIISLLYGQIGHFLCFVLFFIPLRVFLGGYHAKKSETCFLMSLTVYAVTMVVMKYNLMLYQNKYMLYVTIVVGLFIMLFSSEENPNHPLSEKQLRRNKMLVRLIVLLDFTLLFFFINNEMEIASREMMFLMLNGIILLVGKIDHAISKLESVSDSGCF